MKVTLTADQEIRAARIGGRRRINALRRNLYSRHDTISAWGAHIEAACSELAVSIALNLPWTGENVFGEPPFDEPDVGDDIEVRQVARGARLVLRVDRRDLDRHGQRRFVLVEGLAPEFELHGWRYGWECERPEWAHEYPERIVWEVPLAHLHSLELLEVA